jgi:hypothetical protein
MWFLRIALPSVLLIASASLFNAPADDGPADDGLADGARDTSAYQELVDSPAPWAWHPVGWTIR